MKWLAAALLFLWASVAGATNNTTIDSVVAYATFHNIGIKVYYGGGGNSDDDSNLVIRGAIAMAGRDGTVASQIDTLTWFRSNRRGAQSDNADALAEPNPDLLHWYAASALMCGADTLYNIWITVTDGTCNNCPADLGTGAPTLQVRTKVNLTTRYLASLPVRNQIWMSPYGNDSNSGFSPSQPKATWAGALAAMTAPGDQIRLLPGTYYSMRTDSLSIGPYSKVGNAWARYSIVGSPGVTFSGADTTSLVGSNWTAKDIGNGVTAYVFAYASKIWPRVVVVDDSTRLYPSSTFYKFQTDANTVVPTWGTFWPTNGGDSVYIRLPRDASPAGHTIRVARKGCAMSIRSPFWRVDSLRFRDFGAGRDVDIDKPVVSIENQGNVIENCTFDDLGRPGVGIHINFNAGGTYLRTHFNTIQNNLFLAHTIGIAWNGVGNYVGYRLTAGAGCTLPSNPDSTCGEANVEYPFALIECGRGHVIRYNHVVGGSDAFLRFSNDPGDTNQFATTDIDVYQNDIVNNGGDCVEPDGSTGTNVRIYKNTLLGGNTAINYYVTRGPLFFVYNTCVNNAGAVLPRGRDAADHGITRGHCIFANNTFTTLRAEALQQWAQSQNFDNNDYVNQYVYNNIMAGVTGTAFDTGCLLLNEFNWNVGYVPAGAPYAATKYSAASNGFICPTLQAWRDSTYGYGKNDTQTFSLLYGDSTHWDWSPKSTWTDVLGPTKARSFPGVNTGLANHISPGWLFVSRGNSVSTFKQADSTYAGAWKPNGTAIDRTNQVPRAPYDH